MRSVQSHLRDRRAHRRLTRVAADPARATMADVRLLLLEHGAGAERVAEALARAGATGIDATLLWDWVIAFDGIELVKLLCSEMPDYLVEDALVDGMLIHRELSRLLP